MKRSALGGQGASFARRTLFAGAATVGAAAVALAGPQGGEVVQGSAAISNPTAATTQVDQSSDKAVINWKSFNVGRDEKAIFNQPNTAAVTLNRIFDQDPSIIAGLVSANGRLILVNANGMVFENGASVNTAGLIATTADISNGDFMAGNYRFETPGAANAAIVNKGMITAEEGGVVAFVAPSVRNSGVITAKLGRVALGAGHTFVLDLYGDNLISFPISAEIAEQLTGPDGKLLSSLVDVSGKVEAGSVQLSARAARGIIDNVINVDGEIIASGIKQLSAGSTFLTGGGFDPSVTQNDRSVARTDGGGAGNYGGLSGTYGGRIVIDGGANGVRVAGTLDASGAQGGSVRVAGSSVEVRGTISAAGSAGKGGDVSIAGARIALNDATVDASGRTGGGNIAVGYSGEGAARSINADRIFASQGTNLKADAIDNGNGGRVVFWSNLATELNGSISARGGAQSGDGGFLEISSKDQVGFLGSADASAPNGAAGTLLLDPKDIIVIAFGSNTNPNLQTFGQSPTSTLFISPSAITGVLNTGTAVTMQANNDLTVLSDLIVNNPGGNGGALTLQAGRSVLINADITTDNGNLTVIANELLAAGVVNAQRDPGSAVITMGIGADIVAGTGNVRLAILSGAGKTNTASGNLTVRNISASSIRVENLGPSNGNVTVASGSLVASGTGTPLVVASQGGAFVNNAGAGALQAPNGRWIVYSQNPAANTLGGLAGTPYYNTPYNPANPTGLTVTGNRFAYSLAPVLTVTPNNVSRPYGDANPAFTYSVAGLVGGDTLAGAVQGAPSITSLANATSSVAGGPYAITATLGTLASNYNYGFGFGRGVLTITPAQLFYRANPKSREYGDPNGVLTGTVTGLKNGETLASAASGVLTFTSPANEETDVGSYSIVGGGLTVTNGNYAAVIGQDPSSATALTIAPAQLYYIAELITQTYGDIDLDQVGGDLLGIKNGQALNDIGVGSPTFTTGATETSSVGQYAVFGSGFVVTNPNYLPTVLQAPSNATAFAITQAQLFYIADEEDREYGDANPTFSGELDGLADGDSLESVVAGALLFTTSATATSNVGFYAINGSGLTVINPNYALTILQAPENATALEITPAPLTYVADAASRVYGDANPTFTGTVAGLKNSETLSSVTSGTLVFQSSATATTPVGEYGIFGQGLTVTSSNYLPVIEQDDDNEEALQVTPAQLFYLADTKSRRYGQPNPTMTGTVSGLKNGETLASVTTGTLVWIPEADQGDDVGAYGIEGSGLTVTSANYETQIEQDPSNAVALTVTPAQLYYLADPKSRLSGFPNPALTGTLGGLADDDEVENVTEGDLIFSTAATSATLVGKYPITGSGLTVSSGNYLATILQDPSNATALTIDPISPNTLQAQSENANGNESAVDQEQNDMTSRPSDLGIVGVEPVSDDMSDGTNDDLLRQLCALGVPDAAAAPGCASKAGQ